MGLLPENNARAHWKYGDRAVARAAFGQAYRAPVLARQVASKWAGIAAVSGKSCSAHRLLEHTRDELARAHHTVSSTLLREVQRTVCRQAQLVLTLDRGRLDI